MAVIWHECEVQSGPAVVCYQVDRKSAVNRQNECVAGFAVVQVASSLPVSDLGLRSYQSFRSRGGGSNLPRE